MMCPLPALFRPVLVFWFDTGTSFIPLPVSLSFIFQIIQKIHVLHFLHLGMEWIEAPTLSGLTFSLVFPAVEPPSSLSLLKSVFLTLILGSTLLISLLDKVFQARADRNLLVGEVLCRVLPLFLPQPEGITGSSRMKGGSATKVLLETLLLTAHKTVSKDSEISEKCLLEILRTYERAHKVTYGQRKKIAALVKQAGTSLQKKAYVYLVGWHTLGIIAIMDGAECIPTFGADFNDVRGFLIGDHSEMFNREADLIAQGPQFAFSQEDFVKMILPSLTEIDTVLFLFTVDDDLAEVEKLVVQVKEKTSNLQALSHATVGQYLPASLKKLFPSIISIMWPILFLEYEGNFIQKFQRELSTKWILNTVSTGAHVLKGKILRNYMVDLRVSNSKLFWRAVSILQRLTGHSQAKCLDALLQVIYDPQPLSDEIRALEISRHIVVATEKSKVVPMTLLCLLRSCSVQEAQSRLEASPSIRAALDASLNLPGRKRGAEQSDAAADRST
uniref:Glucokinase regulator n=1 Tax=Sphenodon punctatus TaxID=8508 RepID=A0A8D0L9P0_SPHPU